MALQTARQNSDGSYPVSIEGKNTYSCLYVGLPLAANPTDIICVQGFATKTIKIKRICVNVYSGGAPITFRVALARRSTANTGGGATGVSNLPSDPVSPAGSAVWTTYVSTNPAALGTLVGYLSITRLTAVTAGGSSPQIPIFFDFATRMNAPVILRGASDFLCVHCFGDACGVGLDWYSEFEEDNS